MYLKPAEGQEINSILRNLKNKVSCGTDEIPPKLIKKCAKELTLPYYLLVNQSFEEGVFPEQLKCAKIKPIYKKGSKSEISNYRPIALLPTSSKIFEKAMLNRINSFCEKYNIFDNNQFGFRKKRSTVLAVYTYIQEILSALNKKQFATGILLDMTKAYDKVKYDILLDKLYNIGVRGKAHSWLQSYLKNRTQYVEIEHVDDKTGNIIKTKSDIQNINNSIPQGSVIGCLLFLIYINDISKTIQETCVLFADDISILLRTSNYDDLNNNITDILNKTTKWMHNNNLEINYSKTKLMQFRPYQRNVPKLNYKYKDIDIECVDKFNLLGINIDSHLNWKEHIQTIRLKLSRFIYALKQIKLTTNYETALSAYYAYAYAWMKYGILLWGNSTDANSIFILQKKCVRVLVNLKKWESCKPHFIDRKILTVPSMYILEMCKFVRDHPTYYKRYNNTRGRNVMKNMLLAPTCRIEMYRNSPLVTSTKIYNSLPNNIKETQCNVNFQRQLKQYLCEKAFYSLSDYYK